PLAVFVPSRLILLLSTAPATSAIYTLSLHDALPILIGIQIGLLSETTGAPLDSFHLLGHSLGAHVLAYAGKRLNGALGRISGLEDRKSTRLNSSHVSISYAVFCLKKKNKERLH